MDISVVIPVYNMEKYIEDCLKSVIRQTVAFADIIVVDDGSTDSSFSICDKFAKENANILVLRQENQRQGAARNNGFKNVKSEYVMFLDSDDMLQLDAVEKLTKILKKKVLDVLYFDAKIINEIEGYEINCNYNRKRIVSSKIRSGMEYFEEYYPEGYVVQPGMAVYRTRLLQEHDIQFLEGVFYEDNIFALKCMLEAETVSYLPEKLYIRRYRTASVMTGNMTLEKYQNKRDVFSLCWDYLAARKDYVGEKNLLFLASTYMELKWTLEKCNLSGTSPANELRGVIQHLAEAWKELPGVKNITFHTAKRLLFYMEELDMMWETELLSLVLSDGKNSLLEKCKRSYLPYMEQQVERLQFDKPEKRIGVYGMGGHTRRLLKWYTHFKGEIRCKLYFVDTYKESFKENFLGYEVINIKDAKKYVDMIVISSDRYERQMKECIRKIYGDSIHIVEFYNKEKENVFLPVKCINSGIVSKLTELLLGRMRADLVGTEHNIR